MNDSASMPTGTVNATMVELGSFATLGSFEVGADVSYVLLGILLVQAYFYFEHYPKDRWFNKCLIYFLLLVSYLR